MFPVGASSLVVGTTKGLILIGCETLRVFRGAFFEEEVFTFLHKLRLEQGRVPKGQVPTLYHLEVDGGGLTHLPSGKLAALKSC